MRHIRYNGGMIRPKGGKFLAEINRNYGQHRRVFGTQSECKVWIDTEQLAYQREIIRPTPRLMIDVSDAKRLLPQGVTLTEAAKFYGEHHKETKISGATVRDLYLRYIEEKTNAGLRPDSLMSLRTYIGRLSNKLGEVAIYDITADVLVEYLNSMRLSPVSRNNVRRYWQGFFSYCLKLGSIGSNPVDAISISRVDQRMPGILSPDQARNLLKYTMEIYPKLVPMISIGLFAGLRTAELLELDWRDVSNQTIRVTPTVAKRRRQRLIPMSDQLRGLLKPYVKPQGRIAPLRKRRYLELMAKIAKHAGIKEWPHNAMRHSFASYHIARYQDAAKTALILGHTGSAGVLWNNYRELVTENDAKRYFGITI